MIFFFVFQKCLQRFSLTNVFCGFSELCLFVVVVVVVVVFVVLWLLLSSYGVIDGRWYVKPDAIRH